MVDARGALFEYNRYESATSGTCYLNWVWPDLVDPCEGVRPTLAWAIARDFWLSLEM